MRLLDGTVLMHDGLPYDPQKAHEYYMRTRKLHPRQGGGSYTVTTSNGKTLKLSSQQLAEQKVYAAARVEQIKKNLSDLGVILRDKLQKAKESAAQAAKPPTNAEKAKAARDAAAYRNSHKQKIATAAKNAASKTPSGGSTSTGSSKTDTVDSVKKEIATAKTNLKAAVAKQRELATAKKSG